MASAPILEYLRRVIAIQPIEFDDASLVGRFVRSREDAAFAELVRRHGPMVWGVCSRALPRFHDAEEAYQATFLVLARKAASIRPPGLVANWLFGVARRTALEARKRRARIREEPPVDVAAPEPASTDLRDALDEEIGRLPDRFRVPIVLCYLEGRTNAEAADLLSCPEGTVASRLSTARRRLHARLTRRGIASLLGGLTAVSHSRVEAIPPVAATASSTLLAQGVLTAMFIAKVKSVVIAASCIAFLGVAGTAWMQVSAQTFAPPTTAPGGATDQTDAPRRFQELSAGSVASKDLLKKRWDAAHEEFETRKVRAISDSNERTKLFDAVNRLLRAELDLAKDHQARLAAHAGHIDRLTTIARNIERVVKAGQLTAVDQLEIESIRLEAEVRAQQETVGLDARRP